MPQLITRKPQAPLNLSASHVADLDARGFSYIAGICSPRDLTTLRATLPRLFHERAGLKEGTFYDMLQQDVANSPASPTLLKPSNYASDLQGLDCLARTTAIAHALLGDDAVLNMEHAILKPARFGAPTPWHQDEAYRREAEFRYRQLSFWIPLDDADVESGCLHYVAGSNLGEVLAHRSYANDSGNYALECIAPLGAENAVSVAVKAGDCVVHSGRTLHCAGPNRSPNPRLAYILEFEAPPLPLEQKREFSWHRDRNPPSRVARGRWLRSGGIFVEAVRRLRSGAFTPARLRFEWRRSLRVLRSYFM